MGNTSPRGSAGADILFLQKELARQGADLPASGVLDARTRSALRFFQRANGLPVTGEPTPRTLAALGNAGPALPPAAETTEASGTNRAGNAISLHVGLNAVDPDAYGGWSGVLHGCENDANSMLLIAEEEGFATSDLLTAEASATRVLAEIQAAANTLTAGGTFFLTYSGHGAQVPNLIGGDPGDEEIDGKDETLVCWDRMLLDDELRQAFAAFQQGVRIVTLFDECHSGTAHKRYDGVAQLLNAASKRDFYTNLVANAAGAVPRPGPGGENGESVLTREVPYDINLLAIVNNFEMYQDLQASSRSAGAVLASGLSISGCADNQLSQEVNGAGVFSTAVRSTWANNGFAGSYRRFHRDILSQMLPNQTPQLGLFGTNPQQLVELTPFNP